MGAGTWALKQDDKMRAKVKTVIDAGMIILLLLQMAYHLVGDLLHDWVGIMLFALLILHNILDRRWYLGLFKGKYTPIRMFHVIVNLLLLVSFLGVAVSSVFLSTTLSTLFHLKMAMTGRRMHMVLTIWSFILASVHVGLHGNRGIGIIKRKSKSIRFMCRIIIMLASAYGLYAFISRELIQRMFLVSEYVFLDYNESFIQVIIDYIAILCLFSGVTYGIGRLLMKQK